MIINIMKINKDKDRLKDKDNNKINYGKYI